jgi:DNA-binding MarR family transcriptional regulator
MGSQASRPRSRGEAARADAAAAMDAVRRLVRFLRLADRRAEVAAGISAAQLYVLRTLAEAPTASMAELAERTLTDQSSVSTVVARLVERGLVRRGRAAADARKVELALTERGRAAADKSPELAQVAIVEAIERMPPARRRALVASLGGFVRDIGAGPLPARMLFEDEPAAKRRRRTP